MNKTTAWIFGGIALFVLVLCGLGNAVMNVQAGLASFIKEASENAGTVEKQRAIIEQTARLKLPASATVEYFHRLTDGPDGYLEAKLRFPAKDLPKLLAQPAFKRAEWKKHKPADSPFEDRKDSLTWTPSQVKKGRHTQFALPSAPSEYLRVLLDETSATETEVYLNWFQT